MVKSKKLRKWKLVLRVSIIEVHEVEAYTKTEARGCDVTDGTLLDEIVDGSTIVKVEEIKDGE